MFTIYLIFLGHTSQTSQKQEFMWSLDLTKYNLKEYHRISAALAQDATLIQLTHIMCILIYLFKFRGKPWNHPQIGSNSLTAYEGNIIPSFA